MPLLGIVVLSAGGWLLVRDLPFEVLLASAVPAVLFAALLLSWRQVDDTTSSTILSLLLGAVIAAPAAGQLNRSLAELLTAEAVITTTVIAPVVEELTKLSVLSVSLLWMPSSRAPIAGLVYRGALVGLGFAAMENTQYLLFALIQGGYRQMVLALYVRGALGGLQHAMYGALDGVALAFVVRSRTVQPGLTFLALSVALHIAWNGVIAAAITRVLCDESAGFCRPFPNWIDLLAIAPAGALVSLLPGALALRRVRKQAQGTGEAAPTGARG